MKHDVKKDPPQPQPVRAAEADLIPLEDLEVTEVKGGARLFGAVSEFGAAGSKAEKSGGGF
ncbi:MAG: hypothetical protein RL095_3144 [Verrucomicrobiota bacterium]